MKNFINISDISKNELRLILDNAKSRKEKRSKLKMLGVLGFMAGALIKLPLTLAKTTIKAGAAGKGLLGGLLANEFVESLAGAAKTIIAPVSPAKKSALIVSRVVSRNQTIKGKIFAN